MGGSPALCQPCNVRRSSVALGSIEDFHHTLQLLLLLLQAAQARGHPMTVETTAHLLAFSTLNISDGQTLFKCEPQIRDEANRLVGDRG